MDDLEVTKGIYRGDIYVVRAKSREIKHVVHGALMFKVPPSVSSRL